MEPERIRRTWNQESTRAGLNLDVRDDFSDVALLGAVQVASCAQAVNQPTQKSRWRQPKSQSFA